MSDILTEISKFVETPTPTKFIKYIDTTFNQLDGIEDFARMNVDDTNTKKMILRYSQTMRESAVLIAEIFQDYADKANKEEI